MCLDFLISWTQLIAPSMDFQRQHALGHNTVSQWQFSSFMLIFHTNVSCQVNCKLQRADTRPVLFIIVYYNLLLLQF